MLVAFDKTGVYSSVDGGDSWNKISDTVHNFKNRDQAIDSDNCIVVPANDYIYILTNGKGEWLKLNPDRNAFTYWCAAVGPDNEIVVGTDPGLVISWDHGRSWKIIDLSGKGWFEPSARITDVAIDKRGRIFAAADGGTVFCGVPTKAVD